MCVVRRVYLLNFTNFKDVINPTLGLVFFLVGLLPSKKETTFFKIHIPQILTISFFGRKSQ